MPLIKLLFHHRGKKLQTIMVEGIKEVKATKKKKAERTLQLIGDGTGFLIGEVTKV